MIQINKTLYYQKLYKQVFNPEIGSSLGFIGYLQPSSG